MVAGELVELVPDGIALVLEKGPARERQAVAVDAVAAHADDDVACAHVAAVDDLVEGDAADRHSHQIEALDDVLELRRLAARDRDLRHPGALAQAGADRIEHGGVGVRDRDVVEQRERLGADADHVVHVHGDTIDADGVVLPHHLGDDGLGADAVGAERKPDAVELDDVGEVADRQHHPAEPGQRPGLLHPRDDVVEAGIRLGGIHAGLLVHFIAHVDSVHLSVTPRFASQASTSGRSIAIRAPSAAMVEIAPRFQCHGPIRLAVGPAMTHRNLWSTSRDLT